VIASVWESRSRNQQTANAFQPDSQAGSARCWLGAFGSWIFEYNGRIQLYISSIHFHFEHLPMRFCLLNLSFVIAIVCGSVLLDRSSDAQEPGNDSSKATQIEGSANQVSRSGEASSDVLRKEAGPIESNAIRIGNSGDVSALELATRTSADSMTGHGNAGPRDLQMQDWTRQFSADKRSLNYRFHVPLDSESTELNRVLLQQWLAKLDGYPFGELSRRGQVDYLLLKNQAEFELAELNRNSELDSQVLEALPPLLELVELGVIRESVIQRDAERLADQYDRITSELATILASIDSREKVEVEATLALRIASSLAQVRRNLGESHRFYRGYDPQYTWWAEKPFKALDATLYSLQKKVSAKWGGVEIDDQTKIVGQPIGDEAIATALKHAMIPYTPAELVKIAEREFEWCDREYEKASEELGFGDDWRAALEHVKGLHVDPGEQPFLVKNLAWEAVNFLRERDLLTIPPVAANGWRMDMMSPEAQKVNPYFLGGPKIIVAFPTNDMSHEEKRMSLRSNNIHFARATVHHELIPGHHMQHYATPRYNQHREIFNTPFWVEGWALYWEMRLWDLNFHHGPADRVGMLFWRRHRCARIVFSLNYQSGKWTADECVAYLIDRVGHEPSAAAAEVRRSVMGNYGPLYQAAYMLGGLQIRALFEDLVENGTMPEKQFHDLVLQQNSIPIEMVRAAISDVPLNKDYETNWRFAGELD
jgi:hypothetical protein